jgi:hypothetical protein
VEAAFVAAGTSGELLADAAADENCCAGVVCAPRIAQIVAIASTKMAVGRFMVRSFLLKGFKTAFT